ncbi:FLAP-like endonuclease XPG [Klosneuvirus KNV1]|uniref:FLAP-like endonuclease XPG n=1 Tax=Klosneuvirus KNV1 TaxID=1977640 RepID=A0A1V0SJ24_9VIRU|nr:FLAP-like endonuclease XPG [Klosneuvirus KNV1]
MGVNGLRKIISKHAPEVLEKKNFKDFNGTIQALDGVLALYKFCIATIDTPYSKVGHLFACFFKTLSMLRYGIMPFWVFDGKPPEIKQMTLDERRRNKDIAHSKLSDDCLSHNDKKKLEKRTFTVTSKLVEEVIELLKLLGIPYVIAPGEAEAQCVALNKAKIAHGVVTEDWDAILFGCKRMLKDFSNKNINNVTEITTKKLLKKLDITHEQIIDLSSILGNDYCSGINGLKPLDAYYIFKECKFNIYDFLGLLRSETNLKEYEQNHENEYYVHILSIRKKLGSMINKLQYSKIPNNFEELAKTAKDYYLHAPVIEPNEVQVKWETPKYQELYKFLLDKGFEEDLIKSKLNELIMMHAYYKDNNKLVTLSKIKREKSINIDTKIITYIYRNPELIVKPVESYMTNGDIHNIKTNDITGYEYRSVD